MTVVVLMVSQARERIGRLTTPARVRVEDSPGVRAVGRLPVNVIHIPAMHGLHDGLRYRCVTLGSWPARRWSHVIFELLHLDLWRKSTRKGRIVGLIVCGEPGWPNTVHL